MTAVAVDNLRYTYPGSAAPALDGLDLTVDEGEALLLTGRSGCGKSSLLCCLNGLIPHSLGGRREGGVSVAGLDPGALPLAQVATRVGMVFQNPGAQLFRDKVADDVAFGLDNLGVPACEAARRVEQTLDQLGLTPLRDRRIATLSGGERQRVALAGVLAMGARVLLLDEPGSDLDADGRTRLAAALGRLLRDGHTVVVSEHDVDGLLPAAQVLRLADGRRTQPEPAPAPLPARTTRAGGEVVVSLDRVTLGHRTPTVRDLSLELRRGQLVALTGANGSGKSTLLWTLAGLLRPLAGRVVVLGRERRPAPGRVGLLLQNPDEQLLADSVEAELAWSGHGADGWLERLGLAHRAGAHPFSLSRGERQRLALGALLASRPDVLLLDEPTSGLDQASWAALLELVSEQAEQGTAVLFATHHRAAVDAYADRVICLDD